MHQIFWSKSLGLFSCLPRLGMHSRHGPLDAQDESMADMQSLIQRHFHLDCDSMNDDLFAVFWYTWNVKFLLLICMAWCHNQATGESRTLLLSGVHSITNQFLSGPFGTYNQDLKVDRKSLMYKHFHQRGWKIRMNLIGWTKSSRMSNCIDRMSSSGLPESWPRTLMWSIVVFLGGLLKVIYSG